MLELCGPPLVPDDRPQTLGGFLCAVGASHATREALVFDDPLRGADTVRWTYADLTRETERVARALLAAGTLAGGRVGVLMANRPEAVASLFGAALIGAVAVPLSTFAPPDELTQLLELTGVDVLLTQRQMGRRRFTEGLPAGLRCVAAVGDASWTDFLAAGEQVPPAAVHDRADAVRPEDPALVNCSSGTTGRPKAVLHHHRAATLQLWQQATVFARTPQTRMWTALPLFWTAGLSTAIGGTLAAGGCCVLQEGFDAGIALQLLERERVTEPYTLPHQAKALEEHPTWAGTDLSAVVQAYGKSVFPRHPTVTADPGWNMPVGYGLSETCSFFAAHPAGTPRELLRESTGRLLPGNRLRVADPSTGRLLGPGEVGELLVNSPTLMLGYLGRPAQECFDDDGFFATGDLGWYDEAGFVHWSGRRTEMIRTGGANVAPAELEVALRAYPPVKLARAIGVPDEMLGQRLVLCLVLRDGTTTTEAQVQEFLRARLSSYKVPKHVLFLAEEEMPMTGSGTKVRDDALLALAHDRLRHGSRP